MFINLVIVLFLLGLFVGSFLNVLADRLSNGENPFKGRSKCDSCKKKLAPLDLIPIFSFLFLNGRCRYCNKKLSVYYPISELLTGIIFVLVFFSIENNYIGNAGYIFVLLYHLFIASSLIVIFLTDIKYGVISMNVVLLAFIASLVFNLISFPQFFSLYIISALGSFGGFLFIFLITKGRGMGFGDVIYTLLMGSLLGFPKIILGMYIAFISGAVISLILVLSKKKKIKGSTIPFGPFLVVGTFVGIFWGDAMVIKILDYLHI